MKFILDESNATPNTKYILDERFILTEADDVHEVSELFGDIDTYIKNELIKGNESIAAALAAGEITQEEFTKLSSDLNDIQKQLKDLETKCSTAPQSNWIEISKIIDDGFKQIDLLNSFESKIKKFNDIIKDCNEALKEAPDLTQTNNLSWDEKFKEAGNNLKKVDALLDDYLRATFGGDANKVKKLGEPLMIELSELGYTADVNPFINFIKTCLKNNISFTPQTYGAVHNAYISTQINDTDDGGAIYSINEMPLIYDPALYKLSGDTVAKYIKLWSDNESKVEDIEKLFYPDGKTLEPDIKVLTQRISKAGGNATNVIANIDDALVRNFKKNKDHVKKAMRFLIDVYIPESSKQEYYKKYGVQDISYLNTDEVIVNEVKKVFNEKTNLSLDAVKSYLDKFKAFIDAENNQNK